MVWDGEGSCAENALVLGSSRGLWSKSEDGGGSAGEGM